MNAWDFVDTMLKEAEQANEPCSFPPAQVTKLREMIAEITDPIVITNGRQRTRAARGQNLSSTRAIKMPVEVIEQLEYRATALNISFNMMLTHACEVYLRDINDFITEYKQGSSDENIN